MPDLTQATPICRTAGAELSVARHGSGNLSLLRHDRDTGRLDAFTLSRRELYELMVHLLPCEEDDEAELRDAPAHLDSSEASAWVQGFNSCLARVWKALR